MVSKREPLVGQTPSQTVGPFFHYGLPWKGAADLTGSSQLGARLDLIPEGHYHLATPRSRVALGAHIEITGRVIDGEGNGVSDAMIEIWQADAEGQYRGIHDGQIVAKERFIGFGRSSTGEDGSFRFHTIMPGRVPGPANTLQAPHIAVCIFGRGLLKRLVTRLYFEGSEGLDSDPVLQLAPAERRHTLIAKHISASGYSFDIVLQGMNETVFFDC